MNVLRTTRLPRNPAVAYRGQGWAGWAKLLGTEGGGEIDHNNQGTVMLALLPVLNGGRDLSTEIAHTPRPTLPIPTAGETSARPHNDKENHMNPTTENQMTTEERQALFARTAQLLTDAHKAQASTAPRFEWGVEELTAWQGRGGIPRWPQPGATTVPRTPISDSDIQEIASLAAGLKPNRTGVRRSKLIDKVVAQVKAERAADARLQPQGAAASLPPHRRQGETH